LKIPCPAPNVKCAGWKIPDGEKIFLCTTWKVPSLKKTLPAPPGKDGGQILRVNGSCRFYF